jgi:hypothetical protein
MAQYTADQARLLAADAYERYFGRRATEQELAAAIPQFQIGKAAKRATHGLPISPHVKSRCRMN